MELLATKIDTPENKLYHVKLSKPRVARKLNTGGTGYVEVDHVLIGVSSLDKTDAHGTFHYEETTVVGSDEQGEHYPAYLYVIQRALTLDEVLWTIGEVVENNADS